MSSDDVELVRRGIENVHAFWAMLDEHVVWDARPYPAVDIDGVFVGREAVIEMSRRYSGTFDDYQLDAEELIDAGSSVVAVVRERGRGKGSGAPSKGDGHRHGRFVVGGSSAGNCFRTGPTPRTGLSE